MACIINNSQSPSENQSGKTTKNHLSGIRKVYIEPTTECNLSCEICLQQFWDEKPSSMSMDTYNKLLASIQNISTIREVAFWGIGEPLLHPRLPEMIAKVAKLNVETELISNAMLLDIELSEQLMTSGLNRIYVSIDSTNISASNDVRCGASLQKIIQNIKVLNALKHQKGASFPEIGIIFTLMKQNLKELDKLREFAEQFEASQIFVTNLLPYSHEFKDEILYNICATENISKKRSPQNPEITLPRIDLTAYYAKSIGKLAYEAMSTGQNPAINKNYHGICPYIEKGALAVDNTGHISPCVPLMHSYNCYVMGRKKEFKQHTFGNILKQDLQHIWGKKSYQQFREKFYNHAFSPCLECGGGCDLSDANLEDCFGNTHPTCGDCLWGKGIIQCP